MFYGGDGNQDEQEVPKCHSGDDCNGSKDEESLSGYSKTKQEGEVATIMIASHVPAAESLPLTIEDKLLMMFFRYGCNPTVAQKIVED